MTSAGFVTKEILLIDDGGYVIYTRKEIDCGNLSFTNGTYLKEEYLHSTTALFIS